MAKYINSFLIIIIIKGPYNIETDLLNNSLNGPENDLLKEIKEKISLEIEKKEGTETIKKKDRKFMLAETAAYLCHLGQGKEQHLGEECRKTHEKSREDAENAQELVVETRKLVYSTIVEFYDAKVVQNVAAATLDVVGKIVKAGTDAKKAAKYSSKIKIGNEN
jgi:hypothetical protein